MKTFLTILAIVGGLWLLLYSCTHEISYVTVYPRLTTEIKTLSLSESGEVLVQTENGYLIVSVVEAAKNYPNRFMRRSDLRPTAPLPNWSHMIAGVPPPDVLRKFVQVDMVRDENSYFYTRERKKVDAAITVENEAYSYGEAFAWVQFRLYSNRSLYVGLRPPSSDALYFWIELPARLESHSIPRRTKFMSIGG